jgi:hypothetical protein
MAARPTSPRSDIDTTRALNAAGRCGHAKFRRTHGHIITWYGRAVYYARPKMPYGRSTQARAYMTHLTTHGYIAWRGGRAVGAMVWWRCGGSTQHFELLAEPSSPLCPVCVGRACPPELLRNMLTGAVA